MLEGEILRNESKKITSVLLGEVSFGDLSDHLKLLRKIFTRILSIPTFSDKDVTDVSVLGRKIRT